MKNLFIILVGSVLILSCNQPSDSVTDHQHNHEAHDISTENYEVEEHHHATDEPLELNNGEKWIVNDEMKPFVEKSEDLIQGFNPGDDNHIELSENLTEQNNGLIANCTMTGKSHDELHKWLHPHMESVKSLGEAENEAEVEVIYKELINSLDTYHAHFQ